MLSLILKKGKFLDDTQTVYFLENNDWAYLLLNIIILTAVTSVERVTVYKACFSLSNR